MPRKIVSDYYAGVTNLAEEKEPNISLLAWGGPGVGKTQLMGTFPNLFVIDTDMGLLTLAGKDVKRFSIKSEMQVYETCINIIQDAKYKRGPFASGGGLEDIETIGLDSFSKLSIILFEEILEEQSKDKRQAYNVLLKRLTTIASLLRELNDYGYHVVATAGETYKENDLGIVKPMPLINGSFREYVAHYFDASVWMEVIKKNGKPVYMTYCLQEKGHEAKTRFDLPEKVENASFETFKEALDKRFQKED